MSIDDLILLILLTWPLPLARFIFYSITEPVPGRRWRRRLVKFRSLQAITRILLAQKTALILVVAFIFVARWLGDFPGREWVAFVLYSLLVGLAWWASVYQRRVQKPFEDRIRDL